MLENSDTNTSEIGTDEQFDAFMKWAMTNGSDMFSSAANDYVNGGDESKLYSCDFGDLESAAEKNFRAGSLLNICYEPGQMVDGFIHITPYQIEFTDEM